MMLHICQLSGKLYYISDQYESETLLIFYIRCNILIQETVWEQNF